MFLPQEREYGRVFKMMDQIIMTVFICEIILKWYHGFRKFWHQGWNVLDFLIVVSLIIGPSMLQYYKSSFTLSLVVFSPYYVY